MRYTPSGISAEKKSSIKCAFSEGFVVDGHQKLHALSRGLSVPVEVQMTRHRVTPHVTSHPICVM